MMRIDGPTRPVNVLEVLDVLFYARFARNGYGSVLISGSLM